MRRFLHDHSLGIATVTTTAVLYALGQAAALNGWEPIDGGWRGQVAFHGEGVWEFAQSAFLVLASKKLIERGSAESKEETS